MEGTRQEPTEPTSRYRAIAFTLIIVFAIYGAYLLLQPFFNAIIWATVLAVLAYPVYRRLANRFNESLAGLFTVLSTLALIVIPLLAVGAALFFQVTAFAQDLQNSAPAGENGLSVHSLLQRADDAIQPVAESLGAKNFSLSRYYEEHKEELTQNLQEPLGKFLVKAGTSIFTMIVALLTMFFMLRDGHRLLEPAVELVPLPPDRTREIVSRVGATITSVFVGIVLVGLVQGTLAGIGYWVAGVPNAFIWGVASIVLCMIPLLGSPIIYFPLSIALVAQGHVANGLGLLAFCLIVVSNVDNVLRPYVIGVRVNLHYMTIFFSLLGGVFVMGPVGIFAGPMFASAIIALQDAIRATRAEAEGSVAPRPAAPLEATPD